MNKKHVFFWIILLAIFGIPALGLLNRGRMMPMQSELAIDSLSARPEAAPAFNMGYATDQKVTMMAPAEAGATSRIGFVPPQPADGFVAGEERAIVRNASLTAVVDDVRAAVDKVTAIAKSANGYVTSSNINDGDFAQSRLYASLTLRIPADQLDRVMGEVRQLAVQVTNENMSASDQTKQKVDIEAQLKNLRATEAQLMTIMKDAKTVQDTLQVQQQLTQTRQQIEMLEAQQQNLNSNVAMATLNVGLQTKDSDVTYKQNSFIDEIKLALKDAVQLYRELFISGIRNFILIAPVVFIGLIIWGIWKKRKSFSVRSSAK